jgi:hypothetical protein
MEERIGEAFAGYEQLTVMGKQLQVGDPAPDFCLDYLDLADLAVRTISLADSAGLVRLQSAREQPATLNLPASDTTVGSPMRSVAI